MRAHRVAAHARLGVVHLREAAFGVVQATAQHGDRDECVLCSHGRPWVGRVRLNARESLRTVVVAPVPQLVEADRRRWKRHAGAREVAHDGVERRVPPPLGVHRRDVGEDRAVPRLARARDREGAFGGGIVSRVAQRHA